MRLVAWKTVRSRDGYPDEFWFSFGKESITKNHKPFYLFSCSEAEARKAFGDEVDKITGICIVHPINLVLSLRIENEQ